MLSILVGVFYEDQSFTVTISIETADNTSTPSEKLTLEKYVVTKIIIT